MINPSLVEEARLFEQQVAVGWREELEFEQEAFEYSVEAIDIHGEFGFVEVDRNSSGRKGWPAAVLTVLEYLRVVGVGSELVDLVAGEDVDILSIWPAGMMSCVAGALQTLSPLEYSLFSLLFLEEVAEVYFSHLLRE